MSLRELVWMVEEKKRVAGELFAWFAHQVRAAVWSEDPLPPVADLNPYKVVPPKSAAMKRLEEWQNRRKLTVLGTKKKD